MAELNVNEISNSQSGFNTVASRAITKGLKFRQFDGTASVHDVIQEINADFNVEKQHIVRISNEDYDYLTRNKRAIVEFNENDLVNTHCVTARSDNGNIIGVVNKDYGVIQNSQAFEILDMVTNSSVSGKEMKIVSAGLVRNNDPYIQVLLDNEYRVNNDNSNTQFYAFFHTSHDGTSSLKVSFSAIRVVCENTFNMNLNADGFIIKHTKHVDQRLDFTKEYNINCIKSFVASTNLFIDSYINKMNSFSLTKVSDEDIENYINKLFLEEKMGNPDLQISTRMKNQMDAFRDTLENGIGQDTNRGTKLWLMNGTTNYFNNTKSYGNKLESDESKSIKRFDSLMGGYAYRKINMAMDLLTA